MPFLRKYNTLLVTGSTAIRIPLIKRAAVDFAVGADWTPAAGDVKIATDSVAVANVANLPTAVTMGNTAYWEFILTAAELSGKQIVVTVADSATKAVEDQSFLVETYGHASAMYQADFSAANLPANAVQIAGSAVSATTAQIGVNVVNWNNSVVATPTVAGVPEVDITHVNGAAQTATLDTIKAETVTILADTNDIQTRLPAALVSGRMDASVGAMAANVMTAAATAADYVTELQAGLSTLSSANVSAAVWDAATASYGVAGSYGLLVETNIDAAVSSRMATYTQPSGFLAATFPTGTIANTTNITAGTLTTVTTATNVTTVNGLAAGVITAASVATGAIDADAIAADAATEIANAVWDTDATGRQTQGTFGQAIGDPAADTNSIYKAVVTDAAGATVGVDVVALKAETASIQADTNDLQTQVGTAGAGLTNIGTIATVTNLTNLPAITANWLTAAGTAADFGTEVGTAVWATAARTLTAATNITSTGGTTVPQTGDSFARIGAAGVGLTAVALADATSDAVIADAIWNAATASYGTASTYGALIESGNVGGGAIVAASVTGAVGSVTGLTAANLDVAVSTRMATYTQPTGFLAATFPGTVASTTNITSATGVTLTPTTGLGNQTANITGTITTATNVTTLNGIAANVITAASIATGAIDADALATDAVTEIRSIVSGTADSGSTTTMVDAARTEADTDYWKDAAILFTSGTISGQSRLITAFDAATDTITFSPATTQAVGTNTYEIIPNVAAAGATVPTAAEIADAVWDEDATAHQTQGTFGQAIGDPVADSNSIYKAVVTDAAGATVGIDVVAVKAETSSIQTDTNDIQTRLPAALVSGRMDASVGAMAANVMTAAATAADYVTELQAGLSTLNAAAVSTAVWDAATATYGAAGSYGLLVETNLDTTVSSRLSTAGYTAPDNASIAAILVDTGTTLDARIPAALVGGRMDATIDATGMEAGAVDAISDGVLTRNVSNTEGTAGEHTLTTVVLAMLENSISGTSLTIKRTDGTTTHVSKTLTTNPSADPITGIT